MDGQIKIFDCKEFKLENKMIYRKGVNFVGMHLQEHPGQYFAMAYTLDGYQYDLSEKL